jgi:hypothetical protein
VPTEPITFIEATGHVILSAFKEFVPFAFARKKSKSKPAKKKNPPPPKKKSKAKEPPTPPKLTKKQKQEQAKREVLLLTRSLAKLTKALVELNKTRAEQKPIALPTVAKVTEGTKVQVKEVAVAPAMPSAKRDAVAQTMAGAGIVKQDTSFVSGIYAYVSSEAGRNNVLSTVVSFVPFIGEGYDVATLVSGKDPITREQLTPFTKLITAIGLFTGVASGKLAREGMSLALQGLSKELGVSVPELYKIGEEVAQQYKFSSVQELFALKDKVSPKLIEQMIREKAAVKAGKWSYGTFKSDAKWISQFASRGWSEKLVDEAILRGDKYPAINLVNPMNSAIRYVHPITGRSVVIDSVTKEILHVGGDGFLY